jgi:acylaminoacyl-peptidase
MVSDPRISPDGSHIAFVKRNIDADKNKTRSEIWITDITTGSSRQYTGIESSDGSPRWSPDGKLIAFLSDRVKPKSQIFVIPVDGGEAKPASKFETDGTIQAISWSPDGAKIACLYRETPKEYTKEAAEERKTKELPSPVRVHNALNYRYDGFGYIDGSFWQVAVVDYLSGDSKVLTSGDYHCGPPQWSPDSKSLAFLSDRNDDSDLIHGREFIWTIAAEGGEPATIPTPLGDKGSLTWSPDGKLFAYAGNTDVNDPWGTNNTRILVLPSTGGDVAKDLTGYTDRSVGYLSLGDVHDVGAGDEIQWSADSQTLYFPIAAFGDQLVCSVPVTGGEVTSLTPIEYEVGGFHVNSATDDIALTIASPTRSQELGILLDGGVKLLTEFNRPWHDDVTVLEPIPISPPNQDGGTVPGWILKPAGFEPGMRYPLVLYIHGGPHAQYGNTLFHELQWLAAEGFVVLYTNPRGSKGYGEAHTKAIWGDWGGPDYTDLMAAVEYAAGLDYVDSSRTAVMGGSYGGYMTAFIVGRTARFQCAIADRLVSNRHSMSGTTDFAWRHDLYFKGNSWDNPEPLWNCSPLSYAGNVTTPLLLIHSDGDLRCPIGQAEEIFAALRLQGKTVEFVRYPAETSHGMSRNGPPNLRLDRLNRNLAWLNKYIGSRE